MPGARLRTHLHVAVEEEAGERGGQLRRGGRWGRLQGLPEAPAQLHLRGPELQHGRGGAYPARPMTQRRHRGTAGENCRGGAYPWGAALGQSTSDE